MAASIFVWPGFFTNNGTQIVFNQPVAFPDGSVSAPSITFANRLTDGFWHTTSVLNLALNGTTYYSMTTNNAVGLSLQNTLPLGWSSGDPSATAPDTLLFRDAANTLALKNGTNPQIFNIYNTFTDSTHYERLEVGFDNSYPGFVLRAAKGGAGGSAEAIFIESSGVSAINFRQNGATGWQFDTNRNLTDLGNHTITVGGAVMIGSTTLLTATNALTDASGAQVGTITNAPTAGNPTKWITIVDNGTTRKIPTWT